MDESLSLAVRNVFCTLFEEGWIYRGLRIVNWCPKDKTVLSDLEVKEETKEMKASVKRTWKRLTGYTFNVGCPALIPVSRSTCTETGKNKADAQAKCQAKSPLCSVTAAK